MNTTINVNNFFSPASNTREKSPHLRIFDFKFALKKQRNRFVSPQPINGYKKVNMQKMYANYIKKSEKKISKISRRRSPDVSKLTHQTVFEPSHTDTVLNQTSTGVCKPKYLDPIVKKKECKGKSKIRVRYAEIQIIKNK